MVKWYLILVLICISHIMKGIGHLFIYYLHLYIFGEMSQRIPNLGIQDFFKDVLRGTVTG